MSSKLILEVFKNLEEECYAIIKKPSEFPNIAEGSDLDIFCFNIEKVIKNILEVVNNYDYKIIIQKQTTNHIYIDLLKNGDIFLRFDLYSNLPIYKNILVKESFFYAVVKEYEILEINNIKVKIANKENEAILRYIEFNEWFAQRGDKIKHIDFILKNHLNDEKFFEKLHYLIEFRDDFECDKKSLRDKIKDYIDFLIQRYKFLINYIQTRGIKLTIKKIINRLQK